MDPLTAEEKDEKDLRETEGRLEEVLKLLTQRRTRETAQAQLTELRERRDEHASNGQPVAHIHGGHHAPTTMRTKASLDLGESLKENLVFQRYARELETSLRSLSERRVAVLERMYARGPQP
jgi:hypothetical protein